MLTNLEQFERWAGPYAERAKHFVRKYGTEAAERFLAHEGHIRESDTYPIVAAIIEEMFGLDYDGTLSKSLGGDMAQAIARRFDPTHKISQDSYAFLTVLWARWCHRKTGRHVYEVSPALAEKLAHTELRGLKCDDIRLPFSNIFICTPPESGITLWNHDRKDWYPATGVYITEGVSATSKEELELYRKTPSLVMAKNLFNPPAFWGPTIGEGGDGVRSWSLTYCGKGERDTDIDFTTLHFSVPLIPGVFLDKVLKTSAQYMADQMVGNVRWPKEFIKDKVGLWWRKLFDWAMNVVMYATWPDSEVEDLVLNPEARKLIEQLKKHPKDSHKHERARKRLSEIQPQRRVYLGRQTVKLDQPIPKPKESEPRGPINVRTLVQGHWRRVAYGPESALRRWSWIHPFWRGKEGLLVSNPRHIVMGEKEKELPGEEIKKENL